MPKLTKTQLFKRLQPHLKDFTLFEKVEDEPQRTKEEVIEILESKKYHLLKEDEHHEYWVKLFNPGNYSRNKNPKSYLDEGNDDYSLVILTNAIGSEGLVATRKGKGFTYGLYDNGGILNFTELYDHIAKYR